VGNSFRNTGATIRNSPKKFLIEALRRRAFVLFEDRLPTCAVVVRDRLERATSAARLDQIRKFGRRASITLTL
jgi:hypothetical protein